jgi:non-specific serine/threonine protein kinase/serine/threonine-protein kinase
VTPDTWRRITDIFHEALALEPAARAAFLAALSPDDAAHRSAVEALLAANDSDDAFLDTPAARLAPDVAAHDAPPPPRLGPWRVGAEIGRGGMGAVYLALRDDAAYEQRAALKLIRPDALTPDVRRRFLSERQILARLSHPNIAHLLDGGTAPDGRPYLILEYVDGLPITAYADRKGFSTEARLRLFLEVASAVAYAHRNLVVHRDLKPGNILVTEGGVPKLLDFGIAKLLTPDIEGDLTATLVAQRVLTPEYASPEQIRGEPVTTLSDVYSLGVVLFELLTGRRPLRVTSGSLREMERVVGEEEPPLPSSVRPGLSRDLDAIVLKAIRKTPEERYASVERLAEDVSNHLDGRPVIARTPTAAYRFRRFVKRHRTAAVAATLVFLSVVAGVVATVREARIAETQRARAEQRFAEVRKIANVLLFDVDKAIEPLAGSTPARRLIVEKALEYLGSLAKETQGDPALQGELAAAYTKVADVQGNPYYPNLGDTAGAIASYRKGLELREAIVAAAPKDVERRRDLCTVLDRLSDTLLWTGGDVEGEALLRRSHTIREGNLRDAPSHPKVRRDLAVGDFKLGDFLMKKGENAGALASHTRALETLDAVWKDKPGDVGAASDVILARTKIAEDKRRMNDLEGALAVTRSVVADCDAILSAHPENANVRRNREIALNKMGSLLVELKRPAEAATSAREGVAAARALAEADPKNALAASDVAYSLVRLGRALEASKDPAGAVAAYREARDIAAKLVADNPKATTAAADLKEATEALARLGAR